MSGVIDLDIHPTVTGGLEPLTPYLSKPQLERLDFLGAGREGGGFLVGRAQMFAPNRGQRPDTISPKGGPPCSDVDFVRGHLLDRCGIDAALMIPLQPVSTANWTYADEAAWYVTAFNEVMRDTWMVADSRYQLAMTVSPLDPRLAAREIRRFGPTPGVLGVQVPLINVPMGQRHYYPIYEAAQELELPIIQHGLGGWDLVGVTQAAGGLPVHYAERYTLYAQIGQTNLVTMLFEGVFERFPKLKLIMVEWGWTWLPSLLWRADATWKSARVHHPWMKKRPSETVRERVRFTTEPALECDNPEHLRQTVEMMGGENLLVFSTDYPHWDSEEPLSVLRGLSEEARRKIFRQNAIDFLGSRLRLPQTVS
jgi:uncharacterized protein